jgi:hypothetical protein
VNADHSGFAAGTLVHTREGLVPIEGIRVGDMVRSQPAQKGELAYRRVVKTISWEGQDLVVLEFTRIVEDDQPAGEGYVVATSNRPFYVKGKDWAAFDGLFPGDRLEVQDGSTAMVSHLAMIVFRTDVPDVGWFTHRSDVPGRAIDFRDGALRVSTDRTRNDEVLSTVDTYPYLQRTVYNIEVDGFHTYYVGELGLWTHDSITHSGARKR